MPGGPCWSTKKSARGRTTKNLPEAEPTANKPNKPNEPNEPDEPNEPNEPNEPK